MVISAKEQKIIRRPQSRSLIVWNFPRIGTKDAWYRLRLHLNQWEKSMETLLKQGTPKFYTWLLIALGILILTSVALPVFVPQAKYFHMDLDFPEDTARTQLLETMGNWADVHEEAQVLTTENSASKKLYSPLILSVYKVKSGEALSTIANKFGLSLGTVISFNNIKNVKRVLVGMELSIPNHDGLMYSVLRGDSLGLISKKTGISYEALLDANNLESPVIQPGQKLFLPGASISKMELRQALGEMFIMPTQGRFTSGYGYRRDPFTGVRTFHNGVDIANVAGTNVKAAMEGRVSDVGYHSSYGNYVVISHDGGYQTMYAHLLSYKVAKGQKIAQGQSIALMGNTGYSTGTHLHFSVFRRNIPTDPTKLLY